MVLSDEKIEELRQRADILRVIGAHVSLRKQGKRFVGLCPFHSENTPSFSVSPDKGLYYCFGCHAKGDVFTFVQEHSRLDFVSAARWLAKEVGVELEPESPAEARKRQEEQALAQANDYAHAFFQHALWRAGGKAARAYLDERGIPEDFARARRLGFGGAPGELLAYLEAKKVPPRLAAAAGLLTDDGRRSLFDERLVFPIVDTQGRIAGFGGRRLGEGSAPKYVNTRESPLFSKRTLLYGWEVAQETVRRGRRVIIVEGYTDVLACQRAGFTEAVAALGTAFTDEHAAFLGRHAQEAVVLLDADAAGQRASREATERLLAAKLKTSVAPLPAGEDPDSLLRKQGAQALQVRIKAAIPAVEHFIDVAFAASNMTIEDKARAAQGLAPLLDSLGAGLTRDLYVARLAERVGVTTQQLEQHLRTGRRAARPGLRKERGQEPGGAAAVSQPAEREEAQEKEARPQPEPNELRGLCELLLYTGLRARFGELAEYASEPMQTLLQELADSEEAPEAVAARQGIDARWVKRLGAVRPLAGEAAEDIEARATRTFQDVLSRFKARYLRGARAEKLRELEEALARGEATDELMGQIKDLTRSARKLKRAGSPAR